ncbi:glycoside hydrolase family 3 N-terminal domain-containing protein [Pseudoflavonifractor phocaeensis]|uniref:glycoside hydrolase family 3 N-terminal domain-containing protein n=1 Tax=Pseudoflavonifractor phocaeensis TaxID=1870988 RepID=UPI001F250A3B|nr:glycoside hydrolase family 3 N-terminal domain-containing protein [Pseudoflavonifractor phocaeensis]MCF2596214.1 glycoside hydrolase family 3 protein [Pseudoflavonifractor phocaeensis]
MLSINMDDVIKVLDSIKYHLAALAAVIVLGIAIMVAVRKLPKAKKFLFRGQTGMAMILAATLIVNLICTGPMFTMISLATGGGKISEETSAEASALVEKIAEEGIVLLQNDNATLPLDSGSKLNVFGWGSANPVYGGTGSGSLNDAYPTVSLLEGLANAGISTNEELSKFYTDYQTGRPSVGMRTQDWTLPEPNVSLYTDEMMANAKAFSDTAMVVIARGGGEGADLPTDMMSVVNGTWNSEQSIGGESAYYDGTYDDSLNQGNDWDAGDHFLQLNNREEELLDLVCANFDNVIVVYNGANAFELGFVEDYDQIKSVIWCAGTGQGGFNALGNILNGSVNPSGRMIDTYVYDLTATPTWNNFGSFGYDNTQEFLAGGSFNKNATPSFVNYVENIYVGYKFYETAAAEGLIDYDATVQYPFGYGLSYTSFTQEMGPISVSGGAITFDVTVTNTGSVAGKDVVEVYFNPPYTNGGIEKASANLVAFDKTDIIEPGASETVTISFQVEDMASFDAYGEGAYVLEAGDYVISINADSHTILDSETYTVSSTISYKDGRDSDQTPATRLFDFAEGDVTYLSRADGFANYAQATAAPVNFSMSAEAKANFTNVNNYDPTAYNDPNDVMPTTGAKNGLKLVDLRGVAYDDAQWDQLLDQLAIEEMDTLIAYGGYQTAPVPSIGKVQTYDCDGPASINNNFTGQGSVGFPAGVMIAATWSPDLASEFGRSIGKMANEMDTSGWYAPAMNIHRSAFAGRNFEYYSEDGLLSGKIAARAIQGAEEYGVYAYMKHYALNDQEGNRNSMLCTWSTEQAIREIYLKPFELSVKEGGCDAVMSSFNYIGTEWTGGNKELCTTVLRDEWGFVGMVLTDYFGVYGYMDSDHAIRGGTDFCLVNYDTDTNHVTDTTSATGVQAMRQACKNILYTVVNSRAYTEENLNPGMQGWQKLLIGVDVVIVLAVVAGSIAIVKKSKKIVDVDVEA